MRTVSQSVADSACANPNRNCSGPMIACQSRTPCRPKAIARMTLGQIGRRSRTRAERRPFPPGDEEIKRDDGAVQYEPLGAQRHEDLYHARPPPDSGPSHARTAHHQAGACRQDDARPGATDRTEHAGNAARSARGPARGRRRAARRARLHRAHQGAGARRRSRRQPDARAGAGGRRSARTDATDGRGPSDEVARPLPGDPASRGDPARRPARRRQDDDGGQARQLAPRGAEEEGAPGIDRRLPPRRDRAVAHRSGSGRRGVLPVGGRRSAARHRRPRALPRQAAFLRRADRRYRRPPGDRRGNDAGGRCARADA